MRALVKKKQKKKRVNTNMFQFSFGCVKFAICLRFIQSQRIIASKDNNRALICF